MTNKNYDTVRTVPIPTLKFVETEEKAIPLTCIYMIAHSTSFAKTFK